MGNREYYKTYTINLKDCTQNFNFIEKSIKLRKFLHITKESEDRFLEAKVNISMIYNFMTDCLAWVCFKEIEDIISESFNKYGFIGKTFKGKKINHPTISIYGHNSFHPFERSPYYFKVKNITTEKEAKLENIMIGDYWNMLVIPFFNYFTHIHDLIPYIKEDSELNKKLNPIGSYQRKLIIWYLCDHPEYKSYKEKIIRQISNYENNEELKRWRNATMEIIECVENRDPLYSWDNKFLIQKPIPSIVKEFNINNYDFDVLNKEPSKWNISRFWNRKKS